MSVVSSLFLPLDNSQNSNVVLHFVTWVSENGHNTIFVLGLVWHTEDYTKNHNCIKDFNLCYGLTNEFVLLGVFTILCEGMVLA